MTDEINQSDLLSKADDARIRLDNVEKKLDALRNASRDDLRRAGKLSDSLNGMKSRLRQGMQVRNSLKKFPHLKDIVKDGFDYAGFCNTIEQSPELTPSGMALAKDLFNPNKRIGSALRRGVEQLGKQQTEMFSGNSDTLKNHPIQETWQEVWNDTKTRFSKDVDAYEKMMAKLNEKRGKKIDAPQYPHVVPEIILNQSKMANAAITFGSEPKLLLSDGFMQLPADQQKAIMYHEARHGFEPVTAKVEARKYPLRRIAATNLTLNALSRHYEHVADENAAAFGHAESLTKALEHVAESQMPALKEITGNMGTVAKAAAGHGFAIDRKKAVELMGDIYKPKNIKQKFLSPVVQLGKVVAVAVFDRSFKKFATKSSEKLVEDALNPKLWVVKVGTHPTLSERVAKLLGQKAKER